MSKWNRRIWVLLFCMSCALRAGEPELPSVEDIVNNVNAQFQKVEDYSVTMELKVEMPKIRMPSKKIQFYFKQPDKVKIKADGFAIVPKTGLGASAVELLKILDSAQLLRQEELGSRSYWVVKGTVNPDSVQFGSQSDLGSEIGVDVSIIMWVDCERWVISQTQTVVDSIELFSLSTIYAEHEYGIYLPMKTEVRINTSMLKGMGHKRPSEGPLGDRHNFTEGKSGEQGKIIMEFYNYRINTGLKDEYFLE